MTERVWSGIAKFVVSSLLCAVVFNLLGAEGKPNGATEKEEVFRIPCPDSAISLCSAQLLVLSVPVNDTLRESGWRLIVMYYEKGDSRARLSVFRREREKLVPELTLREEIGNGSPWDEVERFPSWALPGFVIWHIGESPRDQATIVCYTQGEFRVVLETGGADFVDLDGDGIPEVVAAPAPLPGREFPRDTRFIYTWNGSEFILAVKTNTSRLSRLYSPDLVKAVRRAKQTVKK